jgi:hypothetical protein
MTAIKFSTNSKKIFFGGLDLHHDMVISHCIDGSTLEFYVAHGPDNWIFSALFLCLTMSKKHYSIVESRMI